MILCLDVGNSHLFGGLLDGSPYDGKNTYHPDNIQCCFRYQTRVETTSDQFGVFLKNVLYENQLGDAPIEYIAISSVVPNINYSLRAACVKYFKIEPFFLTLDTQTGLAIKIHRIGADMVASAIAAIHRFPQRHLIVVDLGTATTYTAINAENQLIGQVIQAGLKISMQALQTQTANLPAVPILKSPAATGHEVIDAIQSGLYYGQLGAIREICHQLILENFPPSRFPPIVIGTGGFASLFDQSALFDHILNDLVFQGLFIALCCTKNRLHR